jgi:neutral ceramidase
VLPLLIPDNPLRGGPPRPRRTPSSSFLTNIIIFLFAASAAFAAEYKAGVARVDITPQGPIWLSGYADRKHPSEGVLQPLAAKALALEDSKGGRIVIVTTDLIGLPRQIADEVAARVQKQYGLERPRLVLNSSHTHTGPAVGQNLRIMFALDEENQRRVDEYGRKLTDDLVTVIGAALGDLAPASISYAAGEAHFGVNRREPTPKGVKIGVNPAGPVDPSVPVIKVMSPDGKLRAVLFGYACHNTTLTGQFFQISGDYAGYAQAEFEKAHPGTVALFMQLCGADQNPNPRSSLDLAEKHGKALAAEVERVVAGEMRPVQPPLRAAYMNIELAFRFHTRETFERELDDPIPAKVRRAKAMLAAYDARHPVRTTPYPIQAIRFGNDLTLLALGGEVVVDYALRVKREYGGSLIAAGYSNDVMSYIPTARILQEGGYEPVDSMIYYGQPGPYADDVEERIFAGIHKVMKRVGLPRH